MRIRLPRVRIRCHVWESDCQVGKGTWQEGTNSRYRLTSNHTGPYRQGPSPYIAHIAAHRLTSRPLHFYHVKISMPRPPHPINLDANYYYNTHGHMKTWHGRSSDDCDDMVLRTGATYIVPTKQITTHMKTHDHWFESSDHKLQPHWHYTCLFDFSNTLTLHIPKVKTNT